MQQLRFFSPQTYILTLKTRLYLTVLIVFAVLSFFATTAFAIYTTNPNAGSSSTTLQEYGRALAEPGVNLQQFSLFNLDYSSWGLAKLLIGVPNTPNSPTSSQPNVLAQNRDGGALGALSDLSMLMITSPPISGVDYLASVGQDIGIIQKPTYAQGFGYGVLKPVQEIWKAMRNLAYVVFVIIFVIVGIMIMFRSRIDPRTVVTISDALPRIVLALILVTFSYALSGVVIDLIELSVRIIAGAFAFASAGGSFIPIIDRLRGGGENGLNIFQLMRGAVSIDEKTWGDFFGTIAKQIPLIGGLLEHLPSGGLFAVIFGLAIVMAMFRVFMMLLTSLVTIILLTIFSPFQFLFAALPGQGSIIGGWARNMLSAAAVFPVTFLMILLAAIFASTNTNGTIFEINPDIAIGGKWNWSPPPLGVPVSTELISQLIAVGIILTTPRAGEIVRDALKQRAAPWAGEAGAALGGIARRIIPF